MRVLFICEGNRIRSPTAEAYYNQMTGTHDGMSAGVVAADGDEVVPRLQAVLAEDGVDTARLRSKHLTHDMVDQAGKIIYFPSDYMPDHIKKHPKAQFWDVVDPHYARDQSTALMRRVRDDIKQRVTKLVEDISK